jgi:hypothetical protein
MADPVASSPPAGESLAYRPLSGYALVGFALSAFFAVLVMVSTGVALSQGVPFFFPFWVILLAVARLIVSLLGQQQIRNSEGTRAGLGMARAGIWLSIFAGLGYFAYYYVTGLALTSQANAFLLAADGPSSGFFPRLEKAAHDPVEMRTAYLFTLPATHRGGVKPDDAAGMAQVHDQPSKDGGPGKLSSFQRSMLVRAFGPGVAGKVTVEPLGVQFWGFESGSYKVARNYRLRSPEVEMEFLLPVQSSEGESAGQMRQWFVAFNQVQLDKDKRKFTPLAKGIHVLRVQGLAKVLDWVSRLNQGQTSAAFEPAETNWDRLIAAPDQRAAVRQRLTEVLTGRARGFVQPAPAMYDGIGDWEFTKEGQLVLQHRLSMRMPAQGNFPGGVFDLVAETTTRQPIDPAEQTLSVPIEFELSRIYIERAAVGDPERGPPSKALPRRSGK